MNPYNREGLSISSILAIVVLILFIINPKAVLSSIGTLIGFIAVFVLCIALALWFTLHRARRKLEKDLNSNGNPSYTTTRSQQDWLDDSIDEQ